MEDVDEVVESRDEERAMSKQVAGGEMLEYGEVMKRRFEYLDIVAKVLERPSMYLW